MIGLTGGIASGKSTIARTLQSYGATIVDADKFGHQAYEPGTACLNEVVAAFGEHILDASGRIDRRALGDIVFDPEQPQNLKTLNKIVWPYIKAKISEAVENHADGILVVEAAVMIEAGWAKPRPSWYDELWVSWVDEQTAQSRLMSRNHLTAEDALKRIQTQISNEERLQYADVSIETKFVSLTDLERRLATEWKGLFQRYGISGLTANERVLLVDELNEPIGNAPRDQVRAENLRHRATYIFVRHKKTKQLYVQERSMLKDYCPGYFDPVTGGVVSVGESYEENARRELEEELGVTDASRIRHLFTFYHEDPRAKVWGDAWLYETDVSVKELKLQPEEVKSISLMTVDEIIALGENSDGVITPDGLSAIKYYQSHMNGGFFK